MINWEEKLKAGDVKVVGYTEKGVDWIYEPEHDKWFTCIDEMEDWFEENGFKMPKYAFGSELTPFYLNLDSIIESEAEDYDEDVIYRLSGVAELRQAIEEFNEANKCTGSYSVDYGIVVKLFEM
ncbi:MAG: hypothetical protein ACRC68_00035 [Clostridium sp.]